MPAVRYRLGLSACVADTPAGRRWSALRALGARHYELSMLQGPDDLGRGLEALQPATFGVHWPLYAGGDDPGARLLDCGDHAFEAQLQRMRADLAGVGAAYLLVHVPQREEDWPEGGVVGERLAALAGVAAELGLDVAVEPKQSVAHRDGLVRWAARRPPLPAPVVLCLDTNDLGTAVDRHGLAPEPFSGQAAVFHLHARDMVPGGSGLYRHAPPWTLVGPDVREPDTGGLDRLARRDRVVAVQVEVVPPYLDRMGGVLERVRERLGTLGWAEV